MLNPLLYCHLYDILAQNDYWWGIFTRTRAKESPQLQKNIVLHATLQHDYRRDAARKEDAYVYTSADRGSLFQQS